MIKCTPLLYNKVKLTKINGLFMKIGQCKVKKNQIIYVMILTNTVITIIFIRLFENSSS